MATTELLQQGTQDCEERSERCVNSQVESLLDPYEAEVNNIGQRRWLCPECYAHRADLVYA